jgi:catechol 2,3-dioxygenase-like lactoylglutathione lyase family enzyme
MPSIDHIHIQASDPAKTIHFFEEFFGAKVSQQFENLGRKLTVMSFGDKSKLSILHIPPAVKDPKPENASINHIGILVQNIEELVKKLKEAGYSFPIDVTFSKSGARIAFCLGPDNVYLELIERP